MTENDAFLTVGEIAKRIRANPETVRRWLRSGRLKGVMLAGDSLGWRVLESDLARFIASATPANAPTN